MFENVGKVQKCILIKICFYRRMRRNLITQIAALVKRALWKIDDP
jgi:hypothetical protein